MTRRPKPRKRPADKATETAKTQLATESTQTTPIGSTTVCEGYEPSPWWPELSEENTQLAIQSGRGGLLQSIADMRLAIRAANGRYGISRDMKDRHVFEAHRIATNKNESTKIRLHALKTLAAFDSLNQRDDRPEMVQIAIQLNGETVMQSLGESVIDRTDSTFSLDEIDSREWKPGEDDDYSE